MPGKRAWTAALALGLAATPAATAWARARSSLTIDTSGQTLGAALSDLARRSSRELLLASPAIDARAAPRLKGRYTIDQALPLLLAGSGLAYRRTVDGSYIIEVAPALPPPAPDVPVTLPELLVTARSQNSDIRRTENDIQPYKVWSSRDIAHAHATDIDDFLRTRITGDTQALTDVAEATGASRSEVNLRGLGPDQTLILVDGRRMPRLPALAWSIALPQPDLNGLSLAAIDRVEIINATAGGIHGAGATGGAVNLILKRDYQGADFGVTYGLTSRGDAAIARVDGRIGVSSDDGRSQAMIFFGRDWGADLRVGERDFAVRSRTLRATNDPAGFAGASPYSASINVVSLSGANLTLDPAYGGAALGAAWTFVPTGYGGVATDGGAMLLANAGRTNTVLSPGATGEGRSLLTRPVRTSLVVNGRHRFSDTVELYLDGLFIENSGQARFRSVSDAAPWMDIQADAPNNPFQQDILVSFPQDSLGGQATDRTRVTRLTGGLIVDLPHAWKGDIDLSLGVAQVRTTVSGLDLTGDFYAALRSGLPTSGGAVLNPLGGLAAFETAIKPYLFENRRNLAGTNRSKALSLRLAGPLMDAPGGPVTLSLLAEARNEHMPSGTFDLGLDDPDPVFLAPQPRLWTRTRSLSAELRAPLVDRASGRGPLRGLELQLAVRRDHNAATFDADAFGGNDSAAELIRPRNGLTVYTAGLKTVPLDGVMLRASIATGVSPPPFDSYDLTRFVVTADPANAPPEGFYLIDSQPPPDPKRGGTPFGGERFFEASAGARADVKAEYARTLSVGIVVTPSGLEGFRASVDYTHIAKRGEVITGVTAAYTYILKHEDAFPGRVTRAPLTDADRAKGYVAGVVTAVDGTSLNIGRRLMDAVDFKMDYAVPTDRFGDLLFHASATWQPRMKVSATANATLRWTNLVGYSDGPLAWRGNAGVDWSRGPLTLGLNANYYGGYRVAASYDPPEYAAAKVLQQGADRIQAQAYLDVYGARRWALPEGRRLRSIDVRFGVQNLLDHRPPVIATAYPPTFSPYGDPRLRRFELSLVGQF
jgi:outer membrane receptor protein involved in Fe transport